MTPQLKGKEAKTSAASRGTAWHPDFRDKAMLPDTKTVRTNFFVHILAIAATAALFIFVGLREYNLSSANAELAGIEEQIVSNTKINDLAVVLFKKYQAEENRYNESYALVKDPFVFTDFIITLGELMPSDACVKSLDYKGVGKTISLTGTVRGLDSSAGDRAAEFLGKLLSDDRLKPFFTSIVLSSLTRDIAAGNLVMEITFTFKTTGKEPVKK